MYGKKWKPSKAGRREFAETMNAIDSFCDEKGIVQSASSDSYYFRLAGIDYRVSNHTVEASNRRAYDELTGEKLREEYHPGGRESGTVYITAGKTRIIQIYTDLENGLQLDGRGYRI